MFDLGRWLGNPSDGAVMGMKARPKKVKEVDEFEKVFEELRNNMIDAYTTPWQQAAALNLPSSRRSSPPLQQIPPINLPPINLPPQPPVLQIHRMEIDKLSNFFDFDKDEEEPEEEKVQIKRKPSPLCDW